MRQTHCPAIFGVVFRNHQRMLAVLHEGEFMNRTAGVLPIQAARPRTRFARLGLMLAASAALLLTACASPSTTPAASHAGIWGDAAGTGAPYLELDDDGKLSGTDGCNRLIGTWKADGNDITFGELASTRMACEGVDAWLAGAVSATITDTTMTVIGADGSEIGALDRAATDDAPESEEFLGTWGPDDASQPHLVISADGRFTGSDGCNTLAGSWTLNGETLQFDQAVSTLKACPGVTTTLGTLAAATVDDDTLTVLDAAGAAIATLNRTA